MSIPHSSVCGVAREGSESPEKGTRIFEGLDQILTKIPFLSHQREQIPDLREDPEKPHASRERGSNERCSGERSRRTTSLTRRGMVERPLREGDFSEKVAPGVSTPPAPFSKNAELLPDFKVHQ